MEQRKLIIHIIDSLAVGGAEILLRNTIALLPEYDHAVVYLCEPEDLKPGFSPQVKFYFLNYKGFTNLISSVFRLRNIIRSTRPFLVHSHLLFANFLSRLATPKSVPLLFSLHSVYSKDAFKESKGILWLERLSVRSYHSVVAVSKTVIDDYLKWVSFKGRKFILYNFINNKYFGERHPRNNKTDGLRCVAVGNLKELKNYHFLLEAFKQLKNDNISLDIYGNGQLKDELQEIIAKHALPVKLCGVVTDTSTILPGYDLFIQASLHEGYSLTVMEALAMSLPAIVSDIAVLHEMTEDAAHFFSLDSLEGFVQAMRLLKSDPVLRYKYYNASSSIAAKNASTNTYLHKLKEIYAELGKKDTRN